MPAAFSAAKVERAVRGSTGRASSNRARSDSATRSGATKKNFEFSALLEFGLRDGGLRAPVATVSTRRLESLLRRYALPVRTLRDFDKLPIPFRAVATDLETGAAVVLDRGGLSAALRSTWRAHGRP